MMVDIAMSYIRSNIEYFLNKHKTNPNDLEQKNPRIKQSTIFRIQSGATKDPRRSTLEPFAEWAGVSVSDLFEKDFRQLANNKSFDNNVTRVSSKLLPVLSWVQAGTMTSVEAINSQEINEWLPPLSIDDPKGCFYLKVVGISNFPTYIEGDYILVDPGYCCLDLQSGDLIVVRNNTDATFKKLVIESDDRKYLQALNPNFQPNIIEFEEGMELVGLVIDAFRPLGGSKPKRVRKS